MGLGWRSEGGEVMLRGQVVAGLGGEPGVSAGTITFRCKMDGKLSIQGSIWMDIWSKAKSSRVVRELENWRRTGCGVVGCIYQMSFQVNLCGAQVSPSICYSVKFVSRPYSRPLPTVRHHERLLLP